MQCICEFIYTLKLTVWQDRTDLNINTFNNINVLEMKHHIIKSLILIDKGCTQAAKRQSTLNTVHTVYL